MKKWCFTFAVALALPLAGRAHAATLTVTTSAEAPVLDTDDCSPGTGNAACTTLRGAINHARDGDTIVFAPALDGQTISLTRYTNCLTVGQSAGTTCLKPSGGWSEGFVEQFGPSAFYLHDKSITIDASANGLQQGVVIARAAGASAFRLFDVNRGAGLTLRGVTLSQGHARGGAGSRGGGGMGAGGAIFNRGELSIEASTLAGNVAEGGSINTNWNDYFGGGGVGAAPPNSSSAGGPNAAGGFGGGGYSKTTLAGFGGGSGFITPRPPIGGMGETNAPSPPVSPQGFGGGRSGASGGFGGGGSGGSDVGSAHSTWGGGGAGMGGAIFNDAGSVLLRDVTLSGNRAKGGGGGSDRGEIYAGEGGEGIGGALFNYAGQMALDRVTVQGNQVTGGEPGGAARSPGIYNLSDGDCGDRGNVYCSGNKAAALDIRGSLVESLRMNRIGTGSGASVVTGSNNLLATAPVLANGATAAAFDYVLAADFGLDAIPTTLHGGLVDVRVPQAASPAVDAIGLCTGTDQRGVARPQGLACDAGSVERELTRAGACRVKASSPSPGDGASWNTAYPDLQSALRDASCTEVWVAEGLYKPTADAADRDASFVLDREVAVYGGFAGNETLRDQRDPGAHVTVLSGDLDGNDLGSGGISETPNQTRGSNSYHVVTIDAGSASVRVDGLVVTAGRASGGDGPVTGNGAGLYVLSDNVVLYDLRVVGNRAYRGGGVYLDSASAQLERLEISGNLGVTRGGGLYCKGAAKPCSPTLRNITFSGNTSERGAGMLNDATSGNSNPTVVNVTFHGNAATYEGGAVHNWADGGSIDATFENIVAWGNTAGTGGSQFHNLDSTPTIRHAVIQGGCPAGSACTDLSASSPVLGPLQGNGGLTKTHRPGAGSSVVGAADCSAAPSTDQRGVTRPQGVSVACDLGAVEVRQSILDVTVTGQGHVDAAAAPAPLSGGIAGCDPNGGSACHAGYDRETGAANQVTLVATAVTGWHFDAWGGECSAGGVVTLDTDRSCAATFAINQYTVTFVDWDASVLATRTVNHGAAAEAPPDPVRVGYAFTGWDVPFDNVTADLVVTAQYTSDRHTVSGMVSGLAGGSVTLSLNGEQTLTQAADGAFTFPEGLDPGVAYEVIVATQPTAPAQICNVTNGAGTMPDADVTNVQVICAPPQAVLALSVDDGGDYARHGQVRDYRITLENLGDVTADDVAIHAEYGAPFDAAGTTWICTGSGGASCVATGTGPFADQVSLPAGGRVTWIVSIPLHGAGIESSATLRIIADGVPDAVDTDTLVIYRDGFDVEGADGTQVIPPEVEAMIVHGDASEVIELLPSASEGIQTLRVLRDGAATVYVQRLSLFDMSAVRLLLRDVDGMERSTAWIAADTGARLVLGSVGDDQGRVLLLEGAAASIALPVTDEHTNAGREALLPSAG